MTTHPINVQRIVRADGEVWTSLTVSCSHQHRTVPLEECEVCARCERIDWDDSVGAPLVTCSAPSPKWRVAEAGPNDRVSRFMTRDVLCIARDLPIRAAADLLVERSIGGVPVVGDDGRAVGLLSKTDALRALVDEKDVLAGDVMMPLVFSLPESAPIQHAAQLMASEGVHRLVIVDEDERIVGILSALDLARALAEPRQ
jgi:CBS domain-containing protein